MSRIPFLARGLVWLFAGLAAMGCAVNPATGNKQLIGLGLAAGSMASSQVAKYAGTASQALGVLYLKFSRDDESQADQLGLRYMRRASYDPRQMPEVFRMLERLSAAEGGSRLPSW